MTAPWGEDCGERGPLVLMAMRTLEAFDFLHSARTMSFSLMKVSKESFFSCVTSDADATDAAASRPKAIFLKEGMVISIVWSAEGQ